MVVIYIKGFTMQNREKEKKIKSTYSVVRFLFHFFFFFFTSLCFGTYRFFFLHFVVVLGPPRPLLINMYAENYANCFDSITKMFTVYFHIEYSVFSAYTNERIGFACCCHSPYIHRHTHVRSNVSRYVWVCGNRFFIFFPSDKRDAVSVRRADNEKRLSSKV